jgi:hypothetical protein
MFALGEPRFDAGQMCGLDWGTTAVRSQLSAADANKQQSLQADLINNDLHFFVVTIIFEPTLRIIDMHQHFHGSAQHLRQAPLHICGAFSTSLLPKCND